MEPFDLVRARYKLYPAENLARMLDPEYNMYTPKSHRGDRMRTLSNYSCHALVRTLNKTNQEKLYRMMQSDFPVRTFVEGTGFKYPYLHAPVSGSDQFVYVIAGEFKTVQKKQDNPDREVVLVRRYNPEKFHNYIKHYWVANANGGGTWVPHPMEKQVRTYMRNHADDVKPVFKDRLTKAERTKLSLLYMVEPGTYVDGIGGVAMNRRWEYGSNHGMGAWVDNERVYFLEAKRNEVVS